jgi:hypothetical protein
VQISVTRTGGYAGLSELLAQVDSSKLAEAKQTRLASMIESIGFFGMPSTVATKTVGADMFRYEITVTNGSRRHTVSFIDDDSPSIAPLKRLIEALQE